MKNAFDCFFYNQEKKKNEVVNNVCVYVTTNYSTENSTDNRQIIIELIVRYLELFDTHLTNIELREIMIKMRAKYEFI